MKNKSLFIVIIALAAVLVGAAFLYPKLSESYSPEQKIEQTSDEVKQTSEKIEVEKTADFTVYDMNENEVKLSDFFGKPIVVNFWTTWCGPCKSELPAFDDAYSQYKDEVTFLMVNLTDGFQDTKSGVEQFIENGKYSFPVYLDLEYNASDTYGVYSIPETLFINSDGSLLDTYIGAMSEAVLNGFIEKLIGGTK